MADQDIALLGFAVDSGPLKKAAADAEAAAKSIGKTGDAADKTAKSLNTAGKTAAETGRNADALGRIMEKLTGASEKAANATGRVGTSATQASSGMTKLGAAAGAAAPQIGRMSSTVTGFAAALGGGISGGGLAGALQNTTGKMSVAIQTMGTLGRVAGIAGIAVAALAGTYLSLASQTADYQDKVLNAEARIRNALGAGVDAPGTVAALREMAQEAGISADSAIDAFARIARSSESLGATRSELLQLSETIQKLGIVSNATPGEIGSGMLQLSQALAAGKLNGDELRSIMENMPSLAKAIADGLDVSVGQLRRMGAEGKLTSDEVFRAILSQTEETRKEFETMPDTVQRSMVRMGNSMDMVKAKLGDLIEASQTMRAIYNGIADLLDEIAGKPITTAVGARERKRELQAEREELEKTFLGRMQLLNKGRGDAIEEEMRLLDIMERQLKAKENEEAVRGRIKKEDAALQRTAQLAGEIDKERSKKDSLQKQKQDLEEGITLAEGVLRESQAAIKRYQQEIATTQAAIITLGVTGANAVAQTAGGLPSFLKTGRGLENPNVLVPFTAVPGKMPGTAAQAGMEEAQARQAAAEKTIEQAKAALKIVGDQIGNLGGGGKAAAAAEGMDKAIRDLERQYESQMRMIAAIGGTRDEVVALEAAQEALERRISTFGEKATPEATAAAGRYEAALVRLKKAQDAAALAQARLSINDGIMDAEAATAAARAGAGGYASRRGAAQRGADRDDRNMPGIGTDRMRAFEANEALALEQRLAAMRLQTSDALARAAAASDAAALRELATRTRIRDLQREAPPEEAERIARVVREEEAAAIEEQRARRNAADKQAQVYMEQEVSLMRMAGRELAIQQAILQRQNELLAEGVSLVSDYAQAQMAAAGRMAEQQFDLSIVRNRIADVEAAFADSAYAIGDVMRGTFSDIFREGGISGKKMMDSILQAGLRVADRLFEAFAVNPLVDALSGLAGGLGKQLGASLFGGGFANGGAFLGGHSLALAGGGVLQGPQFFGMAGGKYGVAGEAGPEGVLPLVRHPSGRLGVEAGGGGGGEVQVNVYDQRRGTDSEPVEVQSGRSSDGMRTIDVYVRDRVKQSIREGELDRDMRAQYGLSRQVARK